MKYFELNKNHLNIVVLTFAILIATLILFLYYQNTFEILENKLIDYNFKLRGATTFNKEIVIVGFTDKCIEQIGPWPWKRSIYAKVIQKLIEFQCLGIGIDVLFLDESINEEDEQLSKVLTNNNIVLAVTNLPKTIYDNGKFIKTKQTKFPIEKFYSVCSNIGFINVDYDNLNFDGILRKIVLFEENESKQIINSFAYQVAKVCNKIKHSFNDKIYYINYTGPVYSYDVIPFSDVYFEKTNINYFKDKIVLMGPYGTALGDLHITPFKTMYGTEVQANILNCIISNSFLNKVSKYFITLIIILTSLVCIYILINKGIFKFTIFTLILLILLLMTNHLLFRINIIFDVVPILFNLVISYFVLSLVYSYLNLIVTNFALNKKVRELNALYSISKNISELINLDKILKDVLNEAITTIGTERGSLMLIDEDEQKLEVKVIAGIEKPFSQKILIPIGEGIAGKVFLECVPIVSNDVSKDERFKKFEDYNENNETKSPIKNILCVPLVISDKKSIGVINIVNKIGKLSFSNEDVKLMETIAHHAATLIENSKLYKLATTDGLTGLYVHRYFQLRFKEEFNRALRYNKTISVLMTDIDHFKKFNDTYGHQCGDMVLAYVAKIVRETIRNTDIAARYGGEEFIIALPETDSEGAYKLAERIRKNVEESSCLTPKGSLKVTISIGVASNALKVDSTTTLIANADAALYKSKENGRNRVTIFQNN